MFVKKYIKALVSEKIHAKLQPLTNKKCSKMLNNFFRINLPYGIAKNDNGEWMAFNREYMPLGFNDYNFKEHPGFSYGDKPIYTKYQRLTEKLLLEVAHHPTKGISRNEAGEIVKVFFYDDRSNPVNQKTDSAAIWNEYFAKLKRLSKVKVA